MFIPPQELLSPPHQHQQHSIDEDDADWITPNDTMRLLSTGYEMENETTLSPTPPEFQSSDYGEIIFLSVLIVIGAPLNLLSLYRSLKAAGHLEFLLARKPNFTRPLSPLFARSRPIGQSTQTRVRSQSAALLHTTNKRNGGRSNKSSAAKVSPRQLTFKLHLTCANLMIVFGYGFSQLVWLCTYSWRGGDILCKFTKFLHTFCFYATSNLVASIAIDRLRVTIHVDRPPSHYQRTVRRMSKVNSFAAAASHALWLHRLVWCAWFLAMISSLPQFFLWRTFAPFRPAAPDWNQCVTIWMAMFYSDAALNVDETRLANAAYYERIYGAIHLAMVFWIPVSVVVLCYAMILTQLHRRIRNSHRDLRHVHKNRRESEAVVFRQRCETMHRTSIVSGQSLSGGGGAGGTTSGGGGGDSTTQPIVRPRTSTGYLMELPIVICSTQPFMGQQSRESFAVVTLTRAKRRTVKTTMWILLAYVACWSPYNILELYRYVIDPEFENIYLQFLSNLIVVNAVVNPLIYGL